MLKKYSIFCVCFVVICIMLGSCLDNIPKRQKEVYKPNTSTNYIYQEEQEEQKVIKKKDQLTQSQNQNQQVSQESQSQKKLQNQSESNQSNESSLNQSELSELEEKESKYETLEEFTYRLYNNLLSTSLSFEIQSELLGKNELYEALKSAENIKSLNWDCNLSPDTKDYKRLKNITETLKKCCNSYYDNLDKFCKGEINCDKFYLEMINMNETLTEQNRILRDIFNLEP